MPVRIADAGFLTQNFQRLFALGQSKLDCHAGTCKNIPLAMLLRPRDTRMETGWRKK